MQRIVFLIGCIALVNVPISAQIASFSQRGKAAQRIPGGAFTIAHPNLPINSIVKVTNTANGKEVEATVIDRVPASNDRIADVSRGVWDALGLNPDTDIILSVSPPPRPRTSEPVPEPPSGLAGNPPPAAPPTAPPVARAPAPSPASSPPPSAGESRPQETSPASNGDIYITLKNMMREVIRENQSASSPSTQVITVYPPYPPQNVVTNQSVINDSVPVNTANPQVTATQPTSVPPQYQAPSVQAAPQYPVPALPPQYPVPALPPQYQVPALPPPQRPALPAAPTNQDCNANSRSPLPNQDCNANSRPQPTKLQIIPRLPNPNSREIYNLQVGSFCDPGAANGLENRLRAAGFNVAREKYNSLHRVIVTGIPAAMVQSTVQRLDAMGIKEIWVKQ